MNAGTKARLTAHGVCEYVTNLHFNRKTKSLVSNLDLTCVMQTCDSCPHLQYRSLKLIRSRKHMAAAHLQATLTVNHVCLVATNLSTAQFSFSDGKHQLSDCF